MPSEEYRRIVDDTLIVRRRRWVIVSDPDGRVLFVRLPRQLTWSLLSYDWDESVSWQQLSERLSRVAQTRVIPERRIGYFLDQPVGEYIEILSFRTEVRYVTAVVDSRIRWWTLAQIEARPNHFQRDGLFWLQSATRHEEAEIEVIRTRKVVRLS